MEAIDRRRSMWTFSTCFWAREGEISKYSPSFLLPPEVANSKMPSSPLPPFKIPDAGRSVGRSVGWCSRQTMEFAKFPGEEGRGEGGKLTWPRRGPPDGPKDISGEEEEEGKKEKCQNAIGPRGRKDADWHWHSQKGQHSLAASWDNLLLLRNLGLTLVGAQSSVAAHGGAADIFSFTAAFWVFLGSWSLSSSSPLALPLVKVNKL